MPISLATWKKADIERVYIRGNDVPDRTYVEYRRGRLQIVGEHEDPQALLREVLAAAGCAGMLDATAWPMILAHGAPPQRGRAAPATGRANLATATGPTSGLHALDIASIPIPGEVTFEVDHREPEALSALLGQAKFAKVERCHLSMGDIRINGSVLVERKTVSDFEASVIDPTKRLFNQAERMSFEPETLCFIVIEGDLYRQANRMTMEQITGAFSYLSAIKGLSVIQVPDMVATAYTLAKIAQHHRHGLGYSLGLRSNKTASIADARGYVLEGLPGINATLASRLMAHFGSVAAVMQASVEQLVKVEGIGKTKAQRIVEVSQGAGT